MTQQTTGQWTPADVEYLKDNSLHLDTFKHYFCFDFSKFIIPKAVYMDNKQNSNKNSSYKMTEETKEFEINFWDLSNGVRIILNKEFTIKLFDNCNIELKGLAELLNVSYPFVVHLRRNIYSIPLGIVLKLSNLSKIPLEEVQNNIVSIRTRAGTTINVKFPIKEDEKIASLIGHVFGDGYVGRNKKQFEYSNNNSQLIKEVKTQIYKLFGILPYTENQNRISYPSIIGEILQSFGAPIAPKIKSKIKAIKKLRQLENKKLVKIIGRVASNRSFLWKLNGGENAIEQT